TALADLPYQDGPRIAIKLYSNRIGEKAVVDKKPSDSAIAQQKHRRVVAQHRRAMLHAQLGILDLAAPKMNRRGIRPKSALLHLDAGGSPIDQPFMPAGEVAAIENDIGLTVVGFVGDAGHLDASHLRLVGIEREASLDKLAIFEPDAAGGTQHRRHSC